MVLLGFAPFSVTRVVVFVDVRVLVVDVGVDDVTTMDAEMQQVAFLPPVHICGNGVRSTAEICDNNNTVGGDGCDALCRIEHRCAFIDGD